MPYPKGIETESKPIAHWKTSQRCYGISEKDMYQKPEHKQVAQGIFWCDQINLVASES